MTREELVVAVLTSAAGQPVDAAFDVAASVLAVWAVVAVVAALAAWRFRHA